MRNDRKLVSSLGRMRAPTLMSAMAAMAIVVVSLVFVSQRVEAAVAVTAATGGGAISTDTAATATVPAWTSLGSIVITEGAATDMAVGAGVTVIMTAPAGFEYNIAQAADVVATGADITGTGTGVVTFPSATTMTLTYTAGAAVTMDVITIGGVTPVQVRPTTGTPATGNILQVTGNAGTATIAGLVLDTTNFGTLTSVVGVASKLAVTGQPSASTVAGVAIATQPIVTVQDQGGNTVTGDTSTVTLALTTGTGTLSGTASMAAVAGIADFTGKGLSIDLVGADKVLTATDGGLTLATTAAFTITNAAAAKLSVTTEPSASTVAGVAFATQPIVTVQDTFGNTVTTDTSTVALALTTGTGVLSGTASMAAVGGVADFTGKGLSIDLVGADKVLTATDGGLTLATTSAFAIAATTASGATSTITASPTSFTVSSGSSTITVQLKDGGGTNLSSGGDTVVLTTDVGTLSSVTDNGDGTYTATLTSAATGTATVSGTVNAGAITDTGTVTINATSAPAPTPTPVVEVVVENTVTTETSTTVDVALSTTASDGSAADVTVPAGALPAGSTLTVSAVADPAALQAQSPPPATVDVKLAFEIKATANGSAVTGDFGSPVALSFTVDAAAVPTGATGDQLQLAFWNGTHWVLVTGTVTVNADGTATIDATTDHFTLFAVLYSADGFGQTFGGTLPSTGLGFVTFGGSTAQLETALVNASCVSPIFVTSNGQWVGFVPTAGVPAVNAAFNALFADGIPLGTPMLATGCND